jgi:hypothetical protein
VVPVVCVDELAAPVVVIQVLPGHVAVAQHLAAVVVGVVPRRGGVSVVGEEAPVGPGPAARAGGAAAAAAGDVPRGGGEARAAVLRGRVVADADPAEEGAAAGQDGGSLRRRDDGGERRDEIGNVGAAVLGRRAA